MQIEIDARNTMKGYQVDVGIGCGKLHDEHQGRKVISEFADEEALMKVTKD